ncbi:PAC2 family protein [Dehalococcoidia bacterium]|nr:PAC2 family protein [Dehalococcoidia bacterium]MCL0064918.1 PAC2 family protein [Dehalococcoidia bacterium]
MGIRFHQKPELEKPDLIAAWPGIGNIGLIAADTLRGALNAQLFAEVEPWDFFYPHAVSIRGGELKDLEFPACRFYFKRLGHKDLIFFVGEQQPGGGRKGYEMASLVLDVASLQGCERIYTAAAAVAPIHHTMKPRVWVVPNTEELVSEVRRYPNIILMSDIEGRGGEGNITGLNGLLLGVARKRGLKGICLLGEMPVYISQFPTPYPEASKSILEVLSHNLGIRIDLSTLERLGQEVGRRIEELYEMIPPEIREHIDRLRDVDYVRQEEPGAITEQDKERIMQNIQEYFKKGGKED